MASGGALHIEFRQSLGLYNASVTVKHSRFQNNDASKVGGSLVFGGAMVVSSNPMISTEPLRVILESCTFIDNWSDEFGGSLYFSGNNKILISGTQFMLTSKARKMKSAVLIFSQSKISLKNVTFDVKKYFWPRKSLSIFDLSDQIFLGSIDINVICPAWFKLSKTDQWRPSNRDQKSYAQFLSLTCSDCPFGKYVPNSNMNKISYKEINVERINVHTNNFLGKPNDCEICPYGASCPGDMLLAKPNFWGYASNRKMKFQRCPHKYCCLTISNNTCPNHNSCQGNRMGILCGACKNGYSVSITSPDCILDSKCSSSWVWPILIFAAFVYVFWYTFKNDIITLIPKLLKKKTCTKVIRGPAEIQKHSCNINKGYFGIITYFIQTAAVLHVPVDFIDDSGQSALQKIKGMVDSILNVEVINYDVNHSTICPFKGFTTRDKTIVRIAFLFGIYISWSIIQFVLNILAKTLIHNKVDIYRLKNEKFIFGFLDICQYTYSGIATVGFASITCVYIADRSVWKFDGTVECLALWQIIVLAILVVYTISLPIYLTFAQKILYLGKISGKQYIFGCLFPAYYIVNWTFKLICKQLSRKISVKDFDSATGNDELKQVLIVAFQETYRLGDKTILPWEAVILFRRLILSMTALINNDVAKTMINIAFCILFTVHHIYVKPFRSKCSNHIEALSLVLLCFVAIFNYAKVFYLETDSISQNQLLSVIQIFSTIEGSFKLLLISIILLLESYLKLKTI